MATPETNGFERINEVFRSLDDQLADWRERFEDGRKKVENEIRKRGEGVADQVGSEFRKATEQVRREIEGELEKRRSQVLDLIGIATKSDLDKLSKRINAISRRLSTLTKEQEKSEADGPREV
jgi:polyhydroxyalkanoate synthesis regulator phasin